MKRMIKKKNARPRISYSFFFSCVLTFFLSPFFRDSARAMIRCARELESRAAASIGGARTHGAWMGRACERVNGVRTHGARMRESRQGVHARSGHTRDSQRGAHGRELKEYARMGHACESVIGAHTQGSQRGLHARGGHARESTGCTWVRVNRVCTHGALMRESQQGKHARESTG